MATTALSLDYETASEAPLVGPQSVGLHNYASSPATRVLMLAYCWNDDGNVKHLDFANGDRMPPEVLDALTDPHVEKWAFNAQFERVVTMLRLGIATPVEGWRCTMALAYMQAFTGTLDKIGSQLGLDAELLKDPNGKRLIKMFSQPQKVTRSQPHLWRDRTTDSEEWQRFCDYNIRDVVAETAQKKRLLRYHRDATEEWRLYEIDQRINDEGLPVDRQFVSNAIKLVARRKGELAGMMEELTGLANPNSGAQLVPWLQDRGYPFADLKKDTVKKVLSENRETGVLAESAVAALKLRQQASRTSVKKYDAILRRIGPDDRLRHCFQYGGASRTLRWAGRGPQPHNLVRTPKMLEPQGEDWGRLESATDAIRNNDYDLLEMLSAEPMAALAGCMRSSFQAHEGNELVVCDLSAIESAVIAWLSGCKRLLNVFRMGLDPYKDYATEFYKKPYEAITKQERGESKPPALGCGFGLGGGYLRDGKRTGLWGYAESMGIDIPQEQAAAQVVIYRTIYHEVPDFWERLARAAEQALRGTKTTVNGLLTFEVRGPYLTVQLPSGRLMYYYKPRMERVEFRDRQNRPYTKVVLTAYGMSQTTKRWEKVLFSGPKFAENLTQASARDVLATGIRRAFDFGFRIVGHVHDEIIAEQRRGDNRYSVAALRDCMIREIFWAKGLPLNAAGYTSAIYRKD